MKKVVITQSNYIPWKGYFDQINLADVLILYDDVQYTRRDWRNRNQIKTISGLQWLTIPVMVKGKFTQKICETTIADKSWAETHYKTILANYAKASCFNEYKTELEEVYQQASKLDYLSEVNLLFINWINQKLGIKTVIQKSSDYQLVDGKTDRLVDLCLKLEATHYISGPAAKNYMEEDKFKDNNIILEYMDYSDYPIYPQLYGDFSHTVTILDLLFNTGTDAKKYMKSIFVKNPQ